MMPPSIAEACVTLSRLLSEVKIRKIGISYHGSCQIKEVCDTGAVILTDELPFNIFSRAIEEEIVPACVSRNIGIIASMTLQQGLLAGIYPTPESVPPHQAHSRHFHHMHAGAGSVSRHGGEGCEKEMFAILPQLEEMAADLHMNIAQLSILWVISKSFINCALIGSRNISELKTNLHALDYCLDPGIIAKIDDISLPVLHKLGNNPDYYEPVGESRIW